MTAPTKPSVFRIPPPVTALLGSAPPSPSSPQSSLAPSESQGGSPASGLAGPAARPLSRYPPPPPLPSTEYTPSLGPSRLRRLDSESTKPAASTGKSTPPPSLPLPPPPPTTRLPRGHLPPLSIPSATPAPDSLSPTGAIAVTSPSVHASEGSVQSSAHPSPTVRSRRASSLSDLKDLPTTTSPTQATGPRSTYRIPSVVLYGSVSTASTDSDVPGDDRQPRIFPVASGRGVVPSQFIPTGLGFHSSPAASTIHLSASVGRLGANSSSSLALPNPNAGPKPHRALLPPSPSFVLNPTWSVAIAPPSRSRVSSLSSRLVPQLSRSVRPSFAAPSFGIPRTLQGSQYALPLDGEYVLGRRPLAGGKTRSASLFAALVDTAGVLEG
ncbi:hypothetical protein AMAG_18479 [Allomyces macrogynus ATCC 38327]|uniref:Uncharacterized protein n=1 Tax=Allomyces macrogynus (strain ATCC 38327) TaxID=578462 RepID=A0A0L0SC69_ALLM3|nr:hypothetical protein AMAG_18479 [Allomyces macrogynus ATCC 38327]|eukprot:KNE60153.1 hypothetical protein AMAG_18479 [Allomyces macrogynus ATCC 38327]